MEREEPLSLRAEWQGLLPFRALSDAEVTQRAWHRG